VLYDSTLEENTFVNALSLIMKGERIPAGTEWRGIPAQPVIVVDPVAVALPMGMDEVEVSVTDIDDDDDSVSSERSFWA
jgi:carbonic anhydrase/acetyltransferase-like protein (isoleucine patch superfamily)